MNPDNLKNVLMERAMPIAPNGLPAPPPNAPSRVPPAMDRYRTSMKMQEAIANGWSPNPTLISILGDR